MKQVNLYQAKTNLSALVDQAASGQETIIAKAGKPLAMLVAYHPQPEKRQLGRLAGQITVRDDFDAPLPADIQAGFGIDGQNSS